MEENQNVSNFQNGQSIQQDIPPIAPLNSERKHPHFLRVVITTLALIVLLLGVLGVYAYIMKTGPFATAPYNEKNLLAGILSATSNIESSAYTASVSLNIQDRDVDAAPFIVKNSDEVKKQYENDSKRAQDVSAILSNVVYKSKYPASLNSLSKSSYYNIKDPKTGDIYTYSLTNSGKNFLLSITFETDDAISKIRESFDFSEATTFINGKT